MQKKWWNPSTCIWDNSKYLKRIADDSKNLCNEIIHTMNIVSTYVANTMLTNTKNTAPKNPHNKKSKSSNGLYLVRDFVSNYSTIHNDFYLSLLH